MSDFSQQMANMIAQARPQQASPGRGVPFATGAPIEEHVSRTNKQTNIGANVDLEAIARLFGYKTDEEIDKLISDIRRQRESLGDDDWQKVRRTDPLQSTLKTIYKRGGGAVTLGDDGLYDVPRMSEEARLRMMEATPSKIAAGGFGEAAMKNLVQSEKAIRGPSPESILIGEQGKEARENFLAGQKAIREPSEEEKILQRAQAENYSQAALHQRELTRLMPEELNIKKEEASAMKRKLLAEEQESLAHANVLSSQASLVKQGYDKDSMDTIQQMNRQYFDYVKSWMEKNALMPDNEDNAYKRNMELLPQVTAYVAGMKSVTNNPTHYEPAIRSWFSHVDAEFDRKQIDPTKWLGMADNQAGLMQVARRKQYIKMGQGLLAQSGVKSYDLAGKLLIWAQKSGLSDEESISLLRSVGMDNEDIVSTLQKLKEQYIRGLSNDEDED